MTGVELIEKELGLIDQGVLKTIKLFDHYGNNRYLTCSYVAFDSSLIEFDKAIWYMRQLFNNGNEGKSGVIEKILLSKDHPAYQDIVYNNRELDVMNFEENIKKRRCPVFYGENSPLFNYPHYLNLFEEYAKITKAERKSYAKLDLEKHIEKCMPNEYIFSRNKKTGGYLIELDTKKSKERKKNISLKIEEEAICQYSK